MANLFKVDQGNKFPQWVLPYRFSGALLIEYQVTLNTPDVSLYFRKIQAKSAHPVVRVHDLLL